jgi:Leucine-rich repeat (LRR) protein
MMGWEDGHPWDLFVKHVLGKLDPQEKEVILNLREQTELGIQLEEKIDPLPITSYDKKISIQIAENKVIGLGIFHVVEELPNYITDLKHLTTLYCYGSMLRAQISEISETFKELKHLQTLGLSNNKLKEIPEWIGDFSDLEQLYLRSNELSSLPDSLAKLSKLKTLDARYNELTVLPKELGNCNELWWLDVGFNKLTEIPSSLGKLEKLYSLKISNNSYKVMPQVAKELEKKGVKVEFEDQFL